MSKTGFSTEIEKYPKPLIFYQTTGKFKGYYSTSLAKQTRFSPSSYSLDSVTSLVRFLLCFGDTRRSPFP